MKAFVNKKSLLVLITVLGVCVQGMAQEEGQKSREEIRAIMEKCFESAGMEKPEQGQRPIAPTDEQRQIVDACLKENNVQPPPHRGGGHHRRDAASTNAVQ
ncbi:hypothetical protein [Bdellovibrio sp. HCB2-146]|uniref:hypothetical protein n=1 Tax=Bdellovibrio sp. HCB2-146 TaxID=3394362 RepID=UPI0039BD5CBD